MKTIFTNAKVVTPARVIGRGGVAVENGVILQVFEGDGDQTDAQVVDCGGNYLAPGFIDTHIHGAGGADFMDARRGSLEKIVSVSADHGTTALLGTTLSSTRERICAALDCIDDCMKNPPPGAQIVGVHLEGNYFSMEQRGAQNPEYIYPPRAEEYENYLSRADIRIVTAAPEAPGACDLARALSRRGICASIGHTCASYEEVVAGIEAGFTHVTHAYNGMSFYSNTNYYPAMGTCESVLLRDELTLEVIADGRHVSPAMLQLLYKIKGADRLHAVSDAVLAGMPEGDYQLGGLDTMITDGVCMLKDRTSFAGSIATADVLLYTLLHKAFIPLCDAVKMLTSTPARVIGLSHRKGRIAPSFDADLNVFDGDVRILATIIGGEFYKKRL